MLRLRAACYWLSAWQQAGAVHHGTRIRRPWLMCVDSLLNRRYLLVSGSVRVRARARARVRVSARVTVRDRDRI